MNLPRIAITMGDPAGVGPEICLQVLTEREITSICTPVVFGDADVMRRCADHLNFAIPQSVVNANDWPEQHARIDQPTIVDFQATDINSLQPGKVSADTGQASYRYITAAIDAAVSGQVFAVTTAPINKEALRSANIQYPGHTEIFADRTNSPQYCMLQVSDEVTCSFVTTHVGYSEVPKLLTVDRINEVIQLSHEAVGRIRGNSPKIVVCGLNPHAGEHGLFGNREEENIIIPAIELARSTGIDIEGPLPPDTCFLPARRRETGCFICMYHDQGHIPLKALAFDTAVNVSLGLPIIRTSVDHGTACDIAWQGLAKTSSMIQALKLAVQLARN
jgi:4-hydroxythreonine-4-phosphate dehydrogenase